MNSTIFPQVFQKAKFALGFLFLVFGLYLSIKDNSILNNGILGAGILLATSQTKK